MVHKIIYGVVYPMGEGRPLSNGGDIDISQPVWCQPSTILTSQLNFDTDISTSVATSTLTT